MASILVVHEHCPYDNQGRLYPYRTSLIRCVYSVLSCLFLTRIHLVAFPGILRFNESTSSRLPSREMFAEESWTLRSTLQILRFIYT